MAKRERPRIQAVRRVLIECSRADQGTDEFLAWKTLLHNMSYRLGEAAGNDPLIGFKVWLRAVKAMMRGGEFARLTGEGASAILDATFAHVTFEPEYVGRQSGMIPKFFIHKNELAGYYRPFRLLSILELTICAWPWMFSCFFQKKQRSNKALIITEILEIAALVHFCKSKGIQHIYDFIPYEADSNFLSICLRKEGIRISKLPSPGPLKLHNATTIADELLVCTQYHLEEIARLPEIRVKQTTLWLPEYSFGYIDLYRETPKTPPKKTIGFYSHGEWLRIKLGHAAHGLDIIAAEEFALESVAKFLQNHAEFQLTIFPHPREKRDEYIAWTQAYYSEKLKGIPFALAGKETRTALSFDAVDVAVSAYSTILFERLFCGFKMLVCNLGLPSFPDRESPLMHITFDDFEVFEKKLLASSEQENQAFFEGNGLVGYRFHEYPYFRSAK